MYGFEKVLEALHEKIEVLTDPDDTSETPTKIFPSGVIEGKPEKISFYQGPGAVLIFGGTEKTGSIGVHRQGPRAEIQGAVIVTVPGTNQKAVRKCIHYTDIVGDLIDEHTALNIPGCTTKTLDNGAHSWRTIDVAKDPKQKTKPNYCTAGMVLFLITKSKE